MGDVEPGASHSTCSIVVPRTAPLYERFRDGLRSRYGRVPVTGFARMTRPRQQRRPERVQRDRPGRGLVTHELDIVAAAVREASELAIPPAG
jgi:hypothetical protein